MHNNFIFDQNDNLISRDNIDLRKGYVVSRIIKINKSKVEKIGNNLFTQKIIFENGYEHVEEINAVDYQSSEGEFETYVDYYITYTEAELVGIANNKLRQKREPLLQAFDLWEKAVLRGREADSEEVMAWYQALLDLEESAFDSIPSAVQYYM